MRRVRKPCDSLMRCFDDSDESGEETYIFTGKSFAEVAGKQFDSIADRRKKKPVKYESPRKTRKGNRSGKALKWVARPLVDAATAAAAADWPLKLQQQRLMRRRLLQPLDGSERRAKDEQKNQKDEGRGETDERESLKEMYIRQRNGEDARKSVKCDFCDGFLWEEELNGHIKRAHGLEPRTEETSTGIVDEDNGEPVCVYPCNQCDDLYFSYDERMSHMCQKHDHKPVDCPWCQEKFYILPDFINHCSSKHVM